MFLKLKKLNIHVEIYGKPNELPEAIPFVENKKIMQPTGDRSNVVIEPMLTDQWYVAMESLAKQGLEVVKDGSVKFTPENWQHVYNQWLENIQ